ncbi:PREDICTED: uncharacterized protein LOC104591945 [Nelumbo nucifera]|uniref:Uncharacterized protein LOC104591945 n=1 Tax=Nelumbo nucifera TaxID=4432 RepID=A0A1U7ZDM2_NELNU|nr:PREDICTED: uncharacterized protein LOC104591945 [Nelumbo nucifera]
MGRKSSSSSTATVMGLRMIQCGRQTAHVIQPDGQVRQFVIPVKVSDLILLHPHHFVAHASSPTSTSSSTAAVPKRSYSSILPLDTQLETGIIAGAGIGSVIKAELKRHWPSLSMSASSATTSFLQFSSRISPEEEGGGVSGSSSTVLLRRAWEPDLQVISEDRVLIFNTTKQESEGQDSDSGSSRKGKKLVSSLLARNNRNSNGGSTG